MAVATRDEVDAYERKLRRTRYGALALGLGVLAAAAASTASLALGQAGPGGVEREPNDAVAEATLLTMGVPVSAHLGLRRDAEHGDRDFYAFDAPASAPGGMALLSLRVSALPNLPMCTMLYRQGLAEAVEQLCVGRPGVDLVLPSLALEPGRYYLGVLQDLRSARRRAALRAREPVGRLFGRHRACEPGSLH